MKGVVVSIVPSYGFIRDGAGTSYYFNPQRMAAGQDYSALKPNMAVEFTEKAGPRGMIADKVSIIEMHAGIEVPKKMITVRGDKRLPGDLIINEQHTQIMQSCWFKSPSDAMDELTHAALQSGANFIAGVTLHKRTFSEGNYNYTMHSFSGTVGTYGKARYFEDKRMAATSRLEAFSYQGEVVNAMAEIAAQMNKQRVSQESGYVGLLFYMIVVAIVLCAIGIASI